MKIFHLHADHEREWTILMKYLLLGDVCRGRYLLKWYWWLAEGRRGKGERKRRSDWLPASHNSAASLHKSEITIRGRGFIHECFNDPTGPSHRSQGPRLVITTNIWTIHGKFWRYFSGFVWRAIFTSLFFLFAFEWKALLSIHPSQEGKCFEVMWFHSGEGYSSGCYRTPN